MGCSNNHVPNNGSEFPVEVHTHSQLELVRSEEMEHIQFPDVDESCYEVLPKQTLTSPNTMPE